MPDDNTTESYEKIRHVVEIVKDLLYQEDCVDLRACFSREKNRRFIALYRLHARDIINTLATLRVEDYSYTSRVTGEEDAYVFECRIPMVDDLSAFLKLQIKNGVVVISFHEPEGDMDFPFRRKK